MEPLLPIDDSEDEACSYLRSVRSQAETFQIIEKSSIEVEECEIDYSVPQSNLPAFKIELNECVVKSVISSFQKVREMTGKLRKPVEKKRNKTLIKRILFEQRPYFDVIQELDYLGVVKVLEIIASVAEEFLKLQEWIYCMLCLLEKPFDLEMYSILNIILKKAIENSNHPGALVIIIIISEYFGQKIPES